MPTSPPNDFVTLANPLHQRLVARHDQRGADRHAASCDRRACKLFADIAIETNVLGEHQPAAAAQPPALDEFALQHSLAHRRAAEHHDFAKQERGAFRQIDVEPAQHPRPVEQNGLLRQPGEMRAGLRLQGNIEPRGGTLGPVDFFRRRRRHREPRPLAGRNIDVETIAAGDAARGIDEYRRQAFRLGRGETHAQRAGFMQDGGGG